MTESAKWGRFSENHAYMEDIDYILTGLDGSTDTMNSLENISQLMCKRCTEYQLLFTLAVMKFSYCVN